MSIDVLRWEGLLQDEEVAHLTTEAARDARYAALPEALAAKTRATIGVDRLYTHQRAVWDAAERREHVLVSTGTALILVTFWRVRIGLRASRRKLCFR